MDDQILEGAFTSAAAPPLGQESRDLRVRFNPALTILS